MFLLVGSKDTEIFSWLYRVFWTTWWKFDHQIPRASMNRIFTYFSPQKSNHSCRKLYHTWMVRDMSTVNKCPKFRSPKRIYKTHFAPSKATGPTSTSTATHSAEIYKVEITSDPNFQAPWLSGDPLWEKMEMKERICLFELFLLVGLFFFLNPVDLFKRLFWGNAATWAKEVKGWDLFRHSTPTCTCCFMIFVCFL